MEISTRPLFGEVISDCQQATTTDAGRNLLIQSEPPKPIVELRSADPERARSSRDVAARARQGRLIGGTFNIGKGCAGIGRWRGGHLGLRAVCAKRYPSKPTLAGQLNRERRQQLGAAEEMTDVDDAAVIGIDHASLDQILQFADVAGIIVFEQRVRRTPAESCEAPTVPWAIDADEMRHQEGDVVAPLAQRRDRDREDSEAEVKILAEATSALRSTLEAATTRTSREMVLLPPTRSTLRS